MIFFFLGGGGGILSIELVWSRLRYAFPSGSQKAKMLSRTSVVHIKAVSRIIAPGKSMIATVGLKKNQTALQLSLLVS